MSRLEEKQVGEKFELKNRWRDAAWHGMAVEMQQYDRRLVLPWKTICHKKKCRLHGRAHCVIFAKRSFTAGRSDHNFYEKSHSMQQQCQILAKNAYYMITFRFHVSGRTYSSCTAHCL